MVQASHLTTCMNGRCRTHLVPRIAYAGMLARLRQVTNQIYDISIPAANLAGMHKDFDIV